MPQRSSGEDDFDDVGLCPELQCTVAGRRPECGVDGTEVHSEQLRPKALERLSVGKALAEPAR